MKPQLEPAPPCVVPTVANRRLNLCEYQKREPQLSSYPRYVAVELTQGCNLSCPMCRRERIAPSTRRMSKALFEQVAETLFPTAELIDLRGWGESLILPEFPDRLGTAAKHCSQIRVVTNLSFVNPDALKALIQHHCHVAVSVDSARQEVLSRLRPGARVCQIANNLRTLSRAYQELWETSSRIVLQCTLQRPSLDTLSELAPFADECGITEIRLARASVAPDHAFSLDGLDDKVGAAIDELVTRSKKLGVQVTAVTQLTPAAEVSPRQRPCLRPWMFACVGYDGTVGFCDHLIGPLMKRYAMGNLSCQIFQEIWNSHSWMALRDCHSMHTGTSLARFPKCVTCYRRRYIDFEEMLECDEHGRKVVLTR